MPHSKNPQLKNAGNLGDILKHSALFQLAILMKARNVGKPVSYVETHAFQLGTDLTNSKEWEDECRMESSVYPAYSAYQGAESSSVSRQQYRCSCGLVIDTLRDRRLFLAEKDPQTRAILQRQLAAENVPCDLLLSDAAGFAFLAAIKSPGPLLALVDPFTLPHAVWSAVGKAVEAIRAPSADGIIEVFSYSEDKPVDWPVATMVRPPYYLAVYATDAIVSEARRELVGLGWEAKPNTN